MDLKLDEIKEILEQPDFNVEQALYEHQQNYWKSAMKLIVFSLCSTNLTPLQRRDKHVRSAKIRSIQTTKVQENEEKYGKEIREKYGNETIEQANKNI